MLIQGWPAGPKRTLVWTLAVLAALAQFACGDDGSDTGPHAPDGGDAEPADAGDPDAGVREGGFSDATQPVVEKSCGAAGTIVRVPGDLAQLAGCTHLLGSLEVIGTAPAELALLVQLRSIDGSLTISQNPAVENLRGLSALRSVGDSLRLADNSSLPDLTGLEQLESVSGELTIERNTALVALRGLEATQGMSAVHLRENPLLRELGALRPVGATTVTVIGNAVLSEADAYLYAQGARFDAVITVSGNRPPSESPDKRCGDGDQPFIRPSYYELAGCTHLQGGLNLGDSSLPHLRALANLRRIDGDFSLFRLSKAINLEGLENLEQVGGYFSVRVTDALVSLDGAGRLRSVGELEISGNGLLRSIAGLASLRQVAGDASIEGNSELPESEVQAFTSALIVGGKLTIAQNKP